MTTIREAFTQFASLLNKYEEDDLATPKYLRIFAAGWRAAKMHSAKLEKESYIDQSA